MEDGGIRGEGGKRSKVLGRCTWEQLRRSIFLGKESRERWEGNVVLGEVRVGCLEGGIRQMPSV